MEERIHLWVRQEGIFYRYAMKKHTSKCIYTWIDQGIIFMDRPRGVSYLSVQGNAARHGLGARGGGG